jgi:hypothetical protein
LSKSVCLSDKLKPCRKWVGQASKTGELLKLVEVNFEVFITSDKNLRYQQNLQDCGFAIVLLPSNQVPIVENLLSRIDEVLKNIQSNDFIEI